MRTSFRLSQKGINIIDNARLRKGWTRASGYWSGEAMISESTLKRFLRGEAVSGDSFVALCQAVGIEDWQSLVAWEDKDSTRVVLPAQEESSLSVESTKSSELSEPSRGKSSLVLSGVFDDDVRLEVETLLDHLQSLLKKSTVTIRKAD